MLEKAYEPKPVEERWRGLWHEAGLFHSEPRDGAKSFTVVIPPPNVTGALHLGHALNNTLQDVLVRWQRLRGREACWVPGTDHGGIATQNVMEKQLKGQNLTRHKLGRAEFLTRMQAWTRETKKTILGQLERLGCALDWKREAFTMDEPRAKAVFHAFEALWKKGLIYRGERMVNWCVRCGTALSDIEVEHEERKGHLWHIHYPLPDNSEGLVVATTRPETMLGDTAVAVNPRDPRYKHLIGKLLRLPLMRRDIPVIGDDHVDMEFGTGAVKVTPAHDPNDFEIRARHPEIDSIRVIGLDGKMLPEAGAYAGLSREQAREKVVDDLKASALLRQVSDHRHAVGVCYRCSSIIEPLLSDQWFVKMEPLTRAAVAAAEEGDFKIHPASWGKPYLEWLKGLKDWCVSRQIWWGHRIPVWYCARCAPMLMFFEEDVVLAEGPNKGMKVRQYHSDLLLKGGLSLDFLLSAAVSMQFLGEFDAARPAKGILVQMERPGRCGTCGGGEFIQDPDVLDTWFSSSLWPMSVFGWPEKTKDLAYYYPTSVLVTGYEILYLWVARMQMMGLAFQGKVPFADAVIHGIVRDKSGKKMSKSLGNVVDPLEMMEKFGTDALRFSLVMQAYPGKDIPFAPDSITGSRNFANKLWNSTRFVLMNLPGGFKVDSGVVLADKASQRGWELADSWIVSEYRRMAAEVTEELEAYNAAAAADAIYAFLWDLFCDWYIELAKPRLTGPEGPGKEAAQGILVGILVNTLKLLHPFMPFITEELYGALKPYCANESAEFLLKAALPGEAAGGGFAHDPAAMAVVMEIVTALRSLRAQLNVPPALRIRVLSTGADRAAEGLLSAHGDYIKTLAHLDSLETAPAGKRPSHCATAVAAGMSFFVPLEGIIDFAKERERIRKEMAKAEAEVAKIAQKVANPDFLSRAPDTEVSLARAQHEAALARQARLRETLQILSD